MKNKFYITTAIPYVNADPHLGFAMELIQGDVLARYHRSLGDDTYFVNGSDENALKNVQAAEKLDLPVKEFVDEHVQKFIKLGQVLNLSNDDFVRTTEERHIRASQKLWQACDKAGDIYKKAYKGLYCVGCEEFKTKKELVDELCPEHKTKPEEVEEENYFFKLSKYQDQLEKLIDSGSLQIIPETKKNEMREFVRQGLEDFSISRSTARAKNWGIDVPNDSSQKIYVWFDALINYITALGYGSDDEELFQKYWTENDRHCHLIGKGINRFHTIYWPAMLLSAGLKPPSIVYVHGYLTIDDEKISKSLGNTIDPFGMIEKYGVDVIRYFLLREIPSDEDGDFSEEKLIARYNGDLANGLGNLVSRVATLIENNLSDGLDFNSSVISSENNKIVDDFIVKYQASLNNFKLHEALISINGLISHADKYVNDTKPWALVKEDQGNFKNVMINLVYMISQITKNLAPFMPETSEKISTVFDFGKDNVIDGTKLNIKKGAVLFPRLQS